MAEKAAETKAMAGGVGGGLVSINEARVVENKVMHFHR